jgi:DNA repair exonuclease SbcCD ATPase subunit
MKLRRIVIEDFRKFTGQLVIDDLQDGINIFTGPNEAGKSSIAGAIRMVFLERYRSTVLGHVVPWQTPAARPQVQVEFETGGRSYRLRKPFIKGQECELVVDGGREKFTGDGAEEALAALLRFSIPARGASTPQHAGVPGLLWITQGQTHELGASVGHAASHLRQALTELAGGKVEQGEDVLIASVQKELHKLLTPRTAQPTGDFAAVEAALNAARAHAQELRKKQDEFAAELERLARLQSECDEAGRRKPWETLAARAEQARRKLAGLRAARDKLTQLDTLRQAGAERTRLLREREQQAQQELALLETLEQSRARAQQAADGAGARWDELRQTEQAAAIALEQARSQWQTALAVQQAQELREQAAQQQAQLERQQHSLQEAEALREQLRATAALAAASDIDKQGLQRLRALDAEIATLQAKTEAASTRLEYRLLAGASPTLDGKPLSGQGQLLLDGEATLLVPGVGELRLIPGASGAGELAATLRERKAQRQALLAALGIVSLAEGETRLAEHQGHRKDHESLEKQLRIYAPGGLPALTDAIEIAQARQRSLQERLSALPVVEDAPQPALARDAAERAQAVHQACQLQARHAHEEQLRLAARAVSVTEELAARRSQIESEAWRARRAAAQRELADALAQEDGTAAQMRAAQAEVDTLGAEVDEEEADNLQTAAANQREAHARMQNEIIALKAKLEQVGASGLGEQTAEAAAHAEQLGRRHAELALRAAALARLNMVLIEERDKAVQKLQAPLVARMEHYFRKLFPQADLTLGEQLTLSGLTRDGAAAEPEHLSFGTQEQIGLLGRFAYADLLREAGLPTLLILDDAVVHTDAERRERLKRALRDAARRHQILIFTCHPEHWDDLPEIARDLRMLYAEQKQ